MQPESDFSKTFQTSFRAKRSILRNAMASFVSDHVSHSNALILRNLTLLHTSTSSVKELDHIFMANPYSALQWSPYTFTRPIERFLTVTVFPYAPIFPL